MSTVPQKYPEAIAWCTTRLASWPADPTTIGLDAADLAELSSLTDAASAARTNALAALAAKLDASSLYRSSGKAMRAKATKLVKKIRAHAEDSADPAAVYALASIPAPADREPTPAPGTPYAFRVVLQQTGSITLAFKCDNPGNVAGVTYLVQRQDAPQTPFNFLTNAPEREFTDNSVPQGASLLVYRVTATRSTGVGEPADFLVRFGAGNQAQVVPSAGKTDKAAG